MSDNLRGLLEEAEERLEMLVQDQSTGKKGLSGQIAEERWRISDYRRLLGLPQTEPMPAA